MEVKAKVLAGKGEWAPFIDILALLIFGGVLFPIVDGLVDQAVIDAFLAFHDHKESSVVAILADLYDTFDRRCEKSSTRIVCCTLALYVWLVSHLFCQEARHACPLEGHRSCTEKKGGKLGPTLGKQRRSVCQLVPPMERRKNRGSYFMQRISKCSLDGDKGLH